MVVLLGLVTVVVGAGQGYLWAHFLGPIGLIPGLICGAVIGYYFGRLASDLA